MRTEYEAAPAKARRSMPQQRPIIEAPRAELLQVGNNSGAEVKLGSRGGHEADQQLKSGRLGANDEGKLPRGRNLKASAGAPAFQLLHTCRHGKDHNLNI